MAEEAAAGGVTLTPFLPDEIIIWEILVHLDPRTLFRCRAVRRSWRLATSSRSFNLAHQARQRTLPIFPCDDPGVQHRSILAFDHRATAGGQLCAVARFDKGFDLEASCDGLLVLSKHNYTPFSRTFSVCNPATREHAFLRTPRGNFKTLAMYLHRPTGEYRLLLKQRIFTSSHEDQTCCYISALGSDRSPTPRSIAGPETLFVRLSLPVRLHDSLHWCPKLYPGDNKRVIIVFDTMAESFRTMRAPIVPTTSCIFEMNDTLGIQSNATKYVDIWVLQNYETEVWELKYRIELPVAEIREKFEGRDWDVDVVSADGGVLLLVSGYRCLLHVDCTGKLIAGFHHGRRRSCMPGTWLKQSLIRHAFFPALDGYAMNDSPFV